MTAPRMDGPAWAMLLFLSVLWGGSFLFTEVILAEVPVFTMVAARLVTAAATLWLVIAALRIRIDTSGAAWRAFAVMAIVNNVVPFSLIGYGQTHLTGGLAAVLNATTPIWTGLLAGLVLPDERLTPSRMLGLLLGLAGVVVVIGPAALRGFGADILAELAVVGAAMSYAVSTVYARRFAAMRISPIVATAGQVTISGVLMLALALAVDAPWTLPAPSAGVLGAILAFGSLSTALAYILFFRILSRAGTNAALVTVLVPAVAVLLGALLLDEPVTGRQLAGMATIFAGLTVIDGRLWRRLLKRTAAAPVAHG
jgi:drug/metabolite transporter (DMT)-like permease